jgi:hypothetical protein
MGYLCRTDIVCKFISLKGKMHRQVNEFRKCVLARQHRFGVFENRELKSTNSRAYSFIWIRNLDN